jgi:hypothetical protein
MSGRQGFERVGSAGVPLQLVVAMTLAAGDALKGVILSEWKSYG